MSSLGAERAQVAPKEEYYEGSPFGELDQTAGLLGSDVHLVQPLTGSDGEFVEELPVLNQLNRRQRAIKWMFELRLPYPHIVLHAISRVLGQNSYFSVLQETERDKQITAERNNQINSIIDIVLRHAAITDEEKLSKLFYDESRRKYFNNISLTYQDEAVSKLDGRYSAEDIRAGRWGLITYDSARFVYKNFDKLMITLYERLASLDFDIDENEWGEFVQHLRALEETHKNSRMLRKGEQVGTITGHHEISVYMVDGIDSMDLGRGLWLRPLLLQNSPTDTLGYWLLDLYFDDQDAVDLLNARRNSKDTFDDTPIDKFFSVEDMMHKGKAIPVHYFKDFDTESKIEFIDLVEENLVTTLHLTDLREDDVENFIEQLRIWRDLARKWNFGDESPLPITIQLSNLQNIALVISVNEDGMIFARLESSPSHS